MRTFFLETLRFRMLTSIVSLEEGRVAVTPPRAVRGSYLPLTGVSYQVAIKGPLYTCNV